METTTTVRPDELRMHAFSALAEFYDKTKEPSLDGRHVRLYVEDEGYKVGKFTTWQLVKDLILQLLEIFGVASKGISGDDGKLALRQKLGEHWNGALAIELPRDQKETIFKATMALKRLKETPETAEYFSDLANLVETSVRNMFGDRFAEFEETQSQDTVDDDGISSIGSDSPATATSRDSGNGPSPILLPSSPTYRGSIDLNELLATARPAPQLPSVPYTLLSLLGLPTFGDSRSNLHTLSYERDAIVRAHETVSFIGDVHARKEDLQKELLQLQANIGSTPEQQRAKHKGFDDSISAIQEKVAHLKGELIQIDTQLNELYQERTVISAEKDTLFSAYSKRIATHEQMILGMIDQIESSEGPKRVALEKDLQQLKEAYKKENLEGQLAENLQILNDQLGALKKKEAVMIADADQKEELIKRHQQEIKVIEGQLGSFLRGVSESRAIEGKLNILSSFGVTSEEFIALKKNIDFLFSLLDKPQLLNKVMGMTYTVFVESSQTRESISGHEIVFNCMMKKEPFSKGFMGAVLRNMSRKINKL